MLPDLPDELLEKEETAPFERKMSSLRSFLMVVLPVILFLYLIFGK